MQKLKPGYLQYLLRRKVIVSFILALGFTSTSFAQLREGLNLPNHDDKPYYFGIVLGYNISNFNIDHSPYFLQQDSIQRIESPNSSRIHLGIEATLQLSKRWDVRFYPLNLIFSQKRFQYNLKYPDPEDGALFKEQKVESIVMSWPLQIRLKSDRIGNFRVYTLAGVKYDYDLASNQGTTNSENLLKVKKSNFGYELGIGFQFFYQYFILSPEIKISNGIGNVLVKDPTLNYNNVIDKMTSRMIMFSLHFEGGGL